MAAWSGDAALWSKLVALVGKAADPGTRTTIVRALGSFSDPKLLAGSYGLLLSGALRPQDIGTRLRQAACTRATLHVAWRWLTGHYDAVLKLEGRETALRVRDYASGFCSTTEHKAFVAFFAQPGKSPPGTRHNLGLALEHIDRCVAPGHSLARPLVAFLDARVGKIGASR